MADTTFVNNVTLTDADWFNDLNRLHYTIFNDPALLGDVLLSTGIPVNHGLSASVNSNALTINLVTNTGATPSTSSPVIVPFRNATLSTGTSTIMSVTSAASMTISSGSTLGTVSDSLVRIWVIGINDGGTFRLGVMNCLINGGTSPYISSFTTRRLWSALIDNGSGVADQAGKLYCNTATTNSPICVLGYVECEIATAGTWTTPTVLMPIRLDTPRPGDILVEASSIDGTVATSTGTIPNDNTTPLSTEGGEFMTVNITNPAVEGLWEFEHIGNYASSNTDNGIQVYLSLGDSILSSRSDSVSTVRAGRPATAGAVTTAVLSYVLPVNSNVYDLGGGSFATDSPLAAIRAGTSSAGTTTFNGSAGAGLFNGTYSSKLTMRSRMY